MPAAARRELCPASREQQPHLTSLLPVPSSSGLVLQGKPLLLQTSFCCLPTAKAGADPSHARLLQPDVGAALLSEDNNLVLKASQNQAAAVKCKEVPIHGPVELQQALVQLYARAKQACVQDVVHFLQRSSQQRQAAPGQSPHTGAAIEQQQGLQESQGSGGLPQRDSGLSGGYLPLSPAHNAVVSQPPPSIQGVVMHEGVSAAAPASKGHGQTHNQVDVPGAPWQQAGHMQMPPAGIMPAAAGPLQLLQQQQEAQQQANLAQDLLTLQQQLPGAPTKVLLQLLHQLCPQGYGTAFAGQQAPAKLQMPGPNGGLKGAELPSGSAQQPHQQTHQPWGDLGSPSAELGLQEPPPASMATEQQGCSSTHRLGWDRGSSLAQLAEAGQTGNPWVPQQPRATGLTPEQALNAALQQQQPDPRSEHHRYAM